MIKRNTIDDLAAEIANKALHDYIYKGKTISEWIDIILKEDKDNGNTKSGK